MYVLRLVVPLALLVPFAQEPAAPRASAPAEDPYPPARVDTAIRFYTLDGGEVDLGKLEPALDALGPGTALLYGPVNTRSRPQDWFVAVQTPAALDEKAVLKALKKGTGRAEQLLVTALTYKPGELRMPQGRYVGNLRDWVVGMASEVRWAEATPTAVLFFYTDGIDAEEVIGRFDKLRGEKPRADYGRDLVKHTVIWNLAAPPDKEVKKATLKKLEKDLGKLRGVASASIDEDMLRLFLTLRVGDLAVSGPQWHPPAPPATEDGGAGGGGGPDGPGGPGGPGGPDRRGAGFPAEVSLGFVPRVFVNQVLDEIEAAGLQVEDEGAAGAPDEPGGK
jgi:hypothetical protein